MNGRSHNGDYTTRRGRGWGKDWKGLERIGKERGSEGEGGVGADGAAVGDGGYPEVVLAGEGSGEEVGAGGPYRGAGDDIPDVMLAGEDAAPGYITRKGIGGGTDGPAVAALEVGGGGEADDGVAGGEGVGIAHVGSPFLDAVFHGEGDDGGGSCGLDSLDKAFPVFHDEGADKGRDGKGEGDDIGGCVDMPLGG